MHAPPIPGFTFLDVVGQGGFADVFRYRQELPTRQVAIKVLRSGSDRASLELFRAEANVMAQLSSHPSIVPIYQAGVSADGRAFLVMEYCPPPHVAQRYRTQPLAVGEVLDIGVKIASAVETAHRAGILHRDIKPHNILTSAFGVPLLTDFGIASVVDQSDGGAQALSIPWSPPEMLSADSHDVRSDVYALSATLYSLLIGHPPFERRDAPNDSAAMMTRIERGQLTPLRRPDVPSSLVDVLRRAMAVRIDMRPASAMALGRQLQDVQIELRQSPTRLEVMDASPTALVQEHPNDARTLIRPVSVIVPSGRSAPRASTGEASGRSLREHSASGSLPPPQRVDRRRLGIGGRLAIVAVTAALVAGVGYAVLAGGEADDQTSGTLRGEKPADPVALAAPAPPQVTKQGGGTRWTFRWQQADPQPGDEFKIRIRTNGVVTGDAEYTKDNARTMTLKRDASVCVEVSLLRPGRPASAPSPEVCAVGR